VNEGLVRRGELYLDVAWVDSCDDELRRMNDGKRGRADGYPDSLVAVLRLFRSFLDTPLRQMEGFLRGLSRIMPRVRPAKAHPGRSHGTALGKPRTPSRDKGTVGLFGVPKCHPDG